MLPLGRHLPLQPAQAPVRLLIPASGNVKSAHGVRTQGILVRARGCYTFLVSEPWRLGCLTRERTPWLSRGPPGSHRGHSPLGPFPLPFSLPQGPGTGPPFLPSEAGNPLEVTSLRHLVADFF
jgi:hypothetical protein